MVTHGVHDLCEDGLNPMDVKKQATIESSDFGAEFPPMKQRLGILRGLRYKLRMMGVPCEIPSYVYGGNMSATHNTQRPESTLKEKAI